MERAADSVPRPSARRGRAGLFSWIAIVALVAGLAAVFVFAVRPSRNTPIRAADASSPYRNTRPGVKYVGDAACVRCHREISETYRKHPMGRSLAPLAQATVAGGDEAGGRTLFKAQGLEYSVERRDGHVFHKETKRDAAGRVIAERQAEVQYVVGSGRRGLSYLIERDGFIIQSPINFYTQASRWGLSPGYEELNYHFDRSAQVGCLYCHTNQFEPVAGTLSRYEPPVFRGHAIGCERCHGPGELHVQNPLTTGGTDLSIVNPGALAPALRDAVCEQCHLTGSARVERPGLHFQDYRPGLPLQRFWTVFSHPSATGEGRFLGQVEQMRASRCYRASAGALGCISCHDPHEMPRPEERVSYYRDRCLECHADRGCSLPAAVRRQGGQGDDCVGCHMHREGNADIPHTALSDHRILRKPETDSQAAATARPRHTGPLILVPFHRALMSPEERAEVQRDKAIALSRDGPEGAAEALPLLERALAAHPDDVPAWQARGVALGWVGRAAEGLRAFQTALKLDPNRENLLKEAAQGATLAGQPETAIACWQRAIAIDPYRSDYWAGLAFLHADRHDWSSAATACRESLRLNPANVEVRKLLVQSCQQLGNAEAVRREEDIVKVFEER